MTKAVQVRQYQLAEREDRMNNKVSTVNKLSKPFLVLFDYDGTLSTPCFTEKDGRILPGKNTFYDNFKPYAEENPPYEKQPPVREMTRISENLYKNGYELGVLSRCGQGSVEIFSKIDSLNKNYPFRDWKENFYGVCCWEQKLDVIRALLETEKYQEIWYVDDNLEILLNIESKLYTEETQLDVNRIKLYHVTTFIEKYREP